MIVNYHHSFALLLLLWTNLVTLLYIICIMTLSCTPSIIKHKQNLSIYILLNISKYLDQVPIEIGELNFILERGGSQPTREGKLNMHLDSIVFMSLNMNEK